ncbi:MAG TPA: UDP-N-acetylmuramoyl-L-alanine--D-glutamate ligase [Jatrophihabitantaceae bacterium]|jgi:UDP-N-acetylmuramoylalanine--D-glutamate ligase|nr:UDP-N-acetylmuramoyl-L-alanine--D-glutamate ligase [Jatrophihabitantaceae bacterium]
MAEPVGAYAAATVRASMTGETVLVCGAGLAGESAVRALLARGARVLLADRVESAAVSALVGAGAEFVGSPTAVPGEVDLVVTSPGWRPDHPLLRSALDAGIEVIGEVEFAWRLRGPDAAPWLAITGTNGKTTTARMLESILQASGARALAVGNVGVSIIDAVTAEVPYDVLSVELSSFQLHWSSTIAPAAGVMLNLAPDHLDWHGSMAAYATAKSRVWGGWLAIGNLDDPQVVTLLASVDTPTRVGFTLRDPQSGELGVRDGMLVDCAFDTALELLPAADIRPAGAHNVANALAAAALARAHGLTAEDVAAGLRSFVPDPHRNQFVATVGGVDFVDDSKATNPHAALASLTAYDRVVWIAGGQLKDAPVDELVEAIAPRLGGAVLLGADRATLADALGRHAPDVPLIEVSSTDDGVMTEVVHAAAGLARPGDTVLLAPAAASYDMFTGYAARGDQFVAAVRRLEHR